MFVYSKIFHAFGDVTRQKFEVSKEVLDAALSIRLLMDTDPAAADDLLDEMDATADSDKSKLLDYSMTLAVVHEATDEIAAAIEAGKEFFIMTEEAGYGVADTADRAKIVFLLGEEDEDERN